MKTEANCKPNSRFLFSDELFSDSGIAMLKAECIKRCKDQPKDAAYERFIHWERQPNEVAVFTLYAYADFEIPKKFQVIFHYQNPQNFILTDFELTQCLYEGWWPAGSVDDGHKHLCIFRFENEIPSILNLLFVADGKTNYPPKGNAKLGFCNLADFPSISARLEKQMALRAQYGEKWWEYDDGQ